MEDAIASRIWGTHDSEDLLNLMAYRVRLEPGDKFCTADGEEGVVLNNDQDGELITGIFAIVHDGIALGYGRKKVPYVCISHELYGKLWDEEDAKITQKTYEEYGEKEGKHNCAKCVDALRCAKSSANMSSIIKSLGDEEFHKC